ncbi:MAG: S41 family peptidase [bacterium]
MKCFKTTILTALLALLPACGMKIVTGSIMSGYYQQLSLNPERLCTPHMFQDVWTGIKEGFYKPLSNKDLVAGSLQGLSEALGKNPEFPIYKSDGEYTAEKFWEFLAEQKENSPKSLSDLCYASIHGIIKSLNDPFSDFVEVEKGETRMIAMLGAKYYGIGFVSTVDYKNKRLYVDIIYPNSPAERGGLKRFDEILTFDNKDIREYNLLAITEKFRGKKGSKAEFSVKRKGCDKLLTLKFTRDIVDYKDAFCEMWQGVPYCHIYGFGNKTMENFTASFSKLPKHHPKKLIIDLRNNRGGMVFTATNMLGNFWLKSKFSTVFVKRQFGMTPFNDNARKAMFEDYKTAVLINGGSASAAEMFAGALKDYKKAVLIGEKTYGKGVIQTSTFIYGAILSITSAHNLTPLGNIIHKKGVKPDIEVKFTLQDLKQNRDTQLEKALQYLKK